MLYVAQCVQSSEAPIIDYSLRSDPVAAGYYRVQTGDTLYSVAWAYHLDYRQLVRCNHLKMPYIIHVGQLLRIESTEPTVSRHVRVEPSVPQTVYRWQWPVRGEIRSRFSSRPLGNQGIDIVATWKTPIVATADGVVVYSGAGIRGYGNLLIVKHSPDYLSAYAFNWRNLVSAGERVSAGQSIAMMGRDNSGQVLLHFEIRCKGVPVDPLHYLGKK